jgi:hypothetical protein
LFPNPTPLNQFLVGEVTLSKDEPLSVDLTIFPTPGAPKLPTATNTPEDEDDEELSDEDEEELSEVLVELSEVLVELSEESSEDEVVLSVLAVLLSSDFAHEETITAMLTIRTNQYKILFILFLFGKCCKIKTTH